MRDPGMLASLQRVTDAALAYLPADELLVELLDRITAILSVDTAAILLLEANGETLRARAAKGLEEEVERGVRIPSAAASPAASPPPAPPSRSRTSTTPTSSTRSCARRASAACSASPCSSPAASSASCTSAASPPGTFTDDDRELLQLAADRAAIAIEHAQLFEQRRIAETLQRRLLPQDLPAIAGLELACRYLPAAGSSLGGDWHDVFELAGGRVVLAVGDVVGHGVAAAAVMAQLRTALRAYAAEGHPPAAVVEAVNRMMFDLGPAAMTTLAYAVLDPVEEALELVVAGHPPPLVARGDRAARYLPLQGSIALGASQTSTYTSEAVPFPPGTMLVLYTDGLVERRGPRSTTGSSGCGRSPRASTTSTGSARRSSTAWWPASRRTTSPWSPPGCRR